MATVPRKVEYPTGDGKPMAETPVHRDAMFDLIKALQDYYADDPMAYVSGNMLLFYEPGNKRRHVSPDVFVTLGIPRSDRPNYLTWEEGKGPDLVIELTSRSTRREDWETKFDLYRDTLRVAEYYLFDPMAEYLKPQLQGYRLDRGEYAAIEPIAGRLPSLVTGLHLEPHGRDLRLFDPALGRWLPKIAERVAGAVGAQHAAEAWAQAEADARLAAEARVKAEADARLAAEAEVNRLRREIEALRRAEGGPN